MTYFPDLTLYKYPGAKNDEKLLNVGWLQKGHVFREGKTHQEMQIKLWKLCRNNRVVQARGFHKCDFCSSGMGVRVAYEGEQLRLGSAEIRVPSEIGITYACPDLIFHYVKDHYYFPPEVFQRALRRFQI